MQYDEDHFFGDSEPDDDEMEDLYDELGDLEDELDSLEIEDDRLTFALVIDHNNSAIELSVAITPRALDGKRYVDILEAFDLNSGELIYYPRCVIPPSKIDEAIDLFVWSVECDPDLTDEQREYILEEIR